ncbi:hypothetical protein GGX14DRAFT_654108 [Mycena pura]|uniref:Uncharacterized protein n=1 Tax=Mycena pura TaxID=153505 RepID=A0AAD6YAF7_9AGAR|nr:hypothetical protein GGX14DRAFT_654108 [Mycena pura]
MEPCDDIITWHTHDASGRRPARALKNFRVDWLQSRRRYSRYISTVSAALAWPRPPSTAHLSFKHQYYHSPRPLTRHAAHQLFRTLSLTRPSSRLFSEEASSPERYVTTSPSVIMKQYCEPSPPPTWPSPPLPPRACVLPTVYITAAAAAYLRHHRFIALSPWPRRPHSSSTARTLVADTYHLQPHCPPLLTENPASSGFRVDSLVSVVTLECTMKSEAYGE